MSYVTGTTHYNLPQTVGTDKRDWADTNQAFADVDAALYSAVDDVAAAATEITALKGRMDTAETNIGQNTSDIAGLDTRLTTAEGAITSQQSQITDTRQDLEDMICAYTEATATSTHAYEIGDYFIYNDVLYRAIQAIAIGDTIVPDTNCTTTNVTSELLATEDLSEDVEQLQTDVTNLQSAVQKLEDTTYTEVYTSTTSVNNVAGKLHDILGYIISNSLNTSALLDNYLITHDNWIYRFYSFGNIIGIIAFNDSTTNTGMYIRQMSVNSSNVIRSDRFAAFSDSYSGGSVSEISSSVQATLLIKNSHA